MCSQYIASCLQTGCVSLSRMATFTDCNIVISVTDACRKWTKLRQSDNLVSVLGKFTLHSLSGTKKTRIGSSHCVEVFAERHQAAAFAGHIRSLDQYLEQRFLLFYYPGVPVRLISSGRTSDDIL